MTKAIPENQTAFMVKLNPTRLEKMTIPVPTPKDGEILIKVEGAGACHSDLHILHGDNPPEKEYVMGHEVCGSIVQHGQSVDQEAYPLGKLVALHGPNGCGSCVQCRKGQDSHCWRKDWFGLGINGGYEEYLVAPARAAVLVPDNVPAAIAAVTTDAVLTPYHSIKRANINALSRVLVIGVGGLGLNAIQICKALGAKVYAHDLRETSLESAKKFGADEVLQTLPEQGLDVDVVLDVVGGNKTFEAAQKHCRPMGTVVPMGLQSPKLEVMAHTSSMREVNVCCTFWGTSSELCESLDLVSRGLVTPQVESRKMDNVGEVLEALGRGEIKNRLVFIP